MRLFSDQIVNGSHSRDKQRSVSPSITLGNIREIVYKTHNIIIGQYLPLPCRRASDFVDQCRNRLRCFGNVYFVSIQYGDLS